MLPWSWAEEQLREARNYWIVPVRPGGEGDWYSLRPRVAFAWREQDFPRSAARFSFPA